MKIHSGLQQIMIYAVGFISIKLISVVMLPLITHFLGPAEFGILEVLQMCINLMT